MDKAKTVLDRALLDELSRPGFRLPALSAWLLNEVWTMDRYKSLGEQPAEYLKQGEGLIHEREKLLMNAGESLYDEIAAPPSEDRSIAVFLKQNPGGSVVIFDGCSIRELPKLVALAHASGRPVLEASCGRAAVPSETEIFIRDRMGLGLPAIAPSGLEGRHELRVRDIRAHWFRKPTERITLEDTTGSWILWMRFPDHRFMDSPSAGPELFDAIWDMLETVWKGTVQALPASRPVLVTSDHGYIYLGPGLADPELNALSKPLDGKRFKEFSMDERLPERSRGLWVDPARRLAVLAGRVHNRPQAPSPSQSLYRHGGLSVMEMLTPWLVLGPEEDRP